MRSMEKTPTSTTFNPANVSNKLLWAYTHMGPGDNYSQSDKRSYVNNSSGHRGPEFSKEADTLIIGCSITYGIGLDLEETWGHIVSQELGFSYNLLAFPGGSIPKIVRQAIEWVYAYGKPKRILALMPEVRRVDLYETVPSQEGFILFNANNLRKKFNSESFIYVDANTNQKSELHDLDYPSLSSYNSLNLLERFCSLLGIDLYWSSWGYSKFFSSYDSYFPLKETEDEIKKCRSHVNNSNVFDMASDDAHPGSHYHLHVAEDFAAKVLSKGE